MAGGGRGSGTGIDGLEEQGDADMTVAAEVSLAVAAKAAAENFPVALRVLPRRYRAHLTALYGFARLVDDIGDEPLPGLPADTPADIVTKTRLRLLDDLARDVAKIYDGAAEPELDAIRALKVTVNDCAVPRQPLDDLIQANRQDQLVTRYQTYEELRQYCELSANPVGQVVLAIMSAATPDRITASDSICTALQLVEHTQDVAEDLANDRIYLPREDMERFRVTELDLAKPRAEANVRQLIKFEADRAQQLLDEGAPLIGTLRGAARIAIAGYLAGGRAALKAIADQNYDVLQSTPKPGKADTLTAMVRCYLKGR
ncbi:MAG TPA: squalene synthase HpnC [Trebonia sp.]|nr:squalene synthase HpnC [Trebonia sp.]